jgi:GWxTD domain-containing protein
MSRRTPTAIVAAVVLAAPAVPGRAELAQIYLDWAAGPAQILMTKADREEWSRLATDLDAENFIRLFWARRDPTPESADNEFQREFERRAAYADQRFAHRTEQGEEVRGALTDRGRLFILLGAPRRVQQPGAGGVTQGGDFGFGESGAVGGEVKTGMSGPGRGGIYEGTGVASEEVWLYEDEHKPDFIKKKRVQIRFRTKPGTEEVNLYQAEEPLGFMAEAVARAVVRPDLQLADLAPAAGPEVVEAHGGFATWGAEVVTDPAGVEALDRALAAGQGAAGVDAHLDAGAFQASDGTWIVPLQVSLAGDAPPGAVLVGELVDAEGGLKLAFRSEREWQNAKGQRVLKATVVAPPGSYQLRTGLAGPAGQVLWWDAEAVEVPPPADDFWVSEVVLSDNIFPMQQAQEMLEPYAWQGVVVVPKGDRTFAQGEVMWYYLHACQPKLTGEGKPNLRLTVQLSGPESFRGPMGVDPVKAGDHCWVLAQGLDLVPDRFPPGDYRMTVHVRDAEAGTNLSSQTDFRVLPSAGG